jgi:hypothetical protein
MIKEQAETTFYEIILADVNWKSVEAIRILYSLTSKDHAKRWNLYTGTFSKATHNLFIHYLRPILPVFSSSNHVITSFIY